MLSFKLAVTEQIFHSRQEHLARKTRENRQRKTLNGQVGLIREFEHKCTFSKTLEHMGSINYSDSCIWAIPQSLWLG